MTAYIILSGDKRSRTFLFELEISNEKVYLSVKPIEQY